MKKLHGYIFVLTLLWPASVMTFPAMAQTQQQPAASSTPRPPPAPKGGSTIGLPSMGGDACIPAPLAATHLPPSFDPPAEWRGKYLTLYVNIRQDGSVEDVHMLRASGSEALDAAAMAQVKRSWRWAPLSCGRSRSNQEVSISVPRLNCLAQGWMPAPSLTLAQPTRDVSAAFDLLVGKDGSLIETRLVQSSDDAALDAALLAHMRQSWHLLPLAEGCPSTIKHILFRLPEMACVPEPVTQSRTAPDAMAAARSLDLQMGVGPDGKLLFATIVRGSGDGALDAAAAAHVQADWRWKPITCKRVEQFLRGEALPVVDFAHIALPAR